MGNVSHGPSIVTDGLVLCLDNYNEQSYLGQPTSNEARYYPTGDAETYRNWLHIWANSGAYSNSDNATDVPKPKGFENSPMRVTSSEVTTVGSLHFANGLRFVNASTQYSFSIYFRQNRAGTPSPGYSPYMRGGNENFSKGSLSYNGGTNASNWPVNEWIRLEGTCTSGSSETYLYISQYIGSYVGDKVWLFAPQIEQKPHVTKFVYTERSATDGWQDLSGNDNHADLTQLSYSATNVPGTNVNNFSFDGTDDYCDLPTLASGSVKTILAWIKNTGGGSSGTVFCPHVNGLDNWFGIESYKIHVFATQSADTNNFYLYGTTTMSVDTWYQIGVTIDYTGKTIKCYVNGVQDNSVTRTHTIGDWGGGAATIGRRGTLSQRQFDGEISNCLIYNEILSATEVLRNYNANKGRYGL